MKIQLMFVKIDTTTSNKNNVEDCLKAISSKMNPFMTVKDVDYNAKPDEAKITFWRTNRSYRHVNIGITDGDILLLCNLDINDIRPKRLGGNEMFGQPYWIGGKWFVDNLPVEQYLTKMLGVNNVTLTADSDKLEVMIR